jgi:hypothetical protein
VSETNTIPASKSDKFNKAVARATGADVAPTVATIIGGADAMITPFDPAELNQLAATGKIEFAPQMMSLEEGQKITGILEGYGPGNDFVNEDTGEIRHVDSWIIASPDGGLRVSILSSAQLDRKLPPFIGGMVGVARNKDLKIQNGHRCADYHVWGPKATDGKRRSWATLPHVAPTPALPAGVVDVTQAQIANGAHPAAHAEDLIA